MNERDLREKLRLTMDYRFGKGCDRDTVISHVLDRLFEELSALAAPTAKGGTEVPAGWKLVPEEPAEEMIRRLTHIILKSAWGRENVIKQYGWLLAASPPPPAGAAGGGSGDLGTLSAGATKKGFSRQDWFKCEFAAAELRRAGHEQSADAVLKAAMIADAPTPDLGAQGEPVAWPAPYQATFNAIQAATRIAGGGTAISVSVIDFYRALALEAPAAPRPGSGVSVEEIAGEAGFLLDRLREFENEHLTDETARDYYGHVMPSIERLTALLALFAQAPRDGGETQGLDFVQCLRHADLGYARWAAKPHNARWSRKIDGTPIRNDLCVNIAEQFMEALSPTPPSGVETIRQDNEGATDA